MTAFYSEFDPKAAAWLRELIKQGHIADGIVDERDLWDVSPADLAGFTQVHLCAGIGVWSYALRRAGWADSRPVWTASFPCQPFSSAGKGNGFDDERHLWPAGFHLIEQCRPDVIFGEQVSSKDGLMWFDLVSADLEGSGYAVGAADTCSAGVGAPHIRQRLYWAAERLDNPGSIGRRARGVGHYAGHDRQQLDADGSDVGLADTISERRRLGQSGGEDASDAAIAIEVGGLALTDGGDASAERQQRGGQQRQQPADGGTGSVADAESIGREYEPISERSSLQPPAHGATEPLDGLGSRRSGVVGASEPGPTNGLWRDADWLLCRDGKWRPVEPGTFPLAYGAPARVGRLRGYGNAINAEAAVAFIEAYIEAIGERPVNMDDRGVRVSVFD